MLQEAKPSYYPSEKVLLGCILLSFDDYCNHKSQYIVVLAVQCNGIILYGVIVAREPRMIILIWRWY